MHDVLIPPEQRRDPAWHDGSGTGRDRCRTPMQWDGSATGGFTTGDPWLPLAPDVGLRNVQAQRNDPHSMLALHRRLIQLRRVQPALSVGDYEPISVGAHTLAYLRRAGGRAFAIALNLGSEPAAVALPAEGRIALSTALDRQHEPVGAVVALRADEGVIVELAPGA